MRLLVIGRSGQLARSLALAAPRLPGIRLEVTGRPEIDLAEPGAAARAIAARRPDLVINAAAFTAVDRAEDEPALAWRINAEAPGEIAAAACAAGAGLIHLSTDYVFDGRAVAPYDEAAAPAPLNAYGRSKLAGEQAVAAANPRHWIVRTSWVVSPFGDNFVRTMCRLARERREIRVVDDQFGRPTSAAALAEALLALAARFAEAEPGLYHLAGGGEPVSWAGLARFIMDVRRDLLGNASTIVPIATADYPAKAERPRRAVLDCSKAAATLGLALPDWRASLSPIVRVCVEEEA